MGTISIEQLPSMLNKPPHAQTTIIADDPFLSFFAEKKIKEHMQKKLKCHIAKHTYQSKNHLAIQTAILSQDMFSENQAHILTIKGTDLKQEALENLILRSKQISILFIIEKITPAQKRTKSYLALTGQSNIILTKTLSSKKTMTWLNALAHSQNIKIPAPLIGQLCQYLDWDLSSMAQLIEQMNQQNIQQASTLKELEPLMLTTHQAPIFTLFEKLFNGDITYCNTFFQTYHQLDILQKIYWMSIKRMRQFILLQERMLANNLTIYSVIQQEKIWPQMKPQYEKALRIPQKKLQYCYLKLCSLEWMIKGKIRQDFKDTAIHYFIHICKAFK
ncbi:MAG: hypothetical protein VX737_00720 [Pseudomonadota bacterium]|nr:hypothetical protein [Pseudomonadota bacterium]